MSITELESAISEQQELFEYYLMGARRAEEAGSSNSAAHNITPAAERASILTALRAMRAEGSAP